MPNLDTLLTLGLVAVLVLVLVIAVLRKARSNSKKAKAAALAAQAPAPVADAPLAPGAAGAVKLNNVSPKTAAMMMAVVADKLGKPINELRFISIKEVE